MKKTFSAFLITLTIVSSLTYSRPSQAAVALLITNTYAVIGGLTMIVGGFPVLNSDNDYSGVGGFMVFLGGIVLDGEEGQALEFSALSREHAKQLKVSEAKRQIFNQEVDLANALLDEVASRTDATSTPADAKEIWLSLKHLVSAETFEVMTKVVSQK